MSIGSGTFAISGDECIAALCRVGFILRRRDDGWTVLERGRRVVVVPDTMVVARPVLDAILAETELTFGAFLRLLDDAPTIPDLTTLPPPAG
jgi:hypothetical protein